MNAIVVFRKSKNSKVYYLESYLSELTVDRINNSNARKPIISDKYLIEELGIGGESLIELYKQRYSIKNHKTIK